MQWAPFSFGQRNAVQRSLYEDNPDMAYQEFANFLGQGQAGFENTVFGRWLKSQQGQLHNQYINRQAGEGPGSGLTWLSFLEGQANGPVKSWTGGGVDQNGEPRRATTPQYGGTPPLLDQFRNLPAYMRGSNSGAMQVRRELW